MQPISSCSLRLDKEDVRVAGGLLLSTALCWPHLCPYGVTVDERETHCLSCKKSQVIIARHNTIKDIICRSLAHADISVSQRASLIVKIQWETTRRA